MLNKNYEALKQNHIKVYESIYCRDYEQDINNVEVRQARNGEDIIIFHNQNQEVYLNSRYNPTAEAYKFMEGVFDMPAQSLLIMFGFSNGSYARSFLTENKQYNRCIIYEPSLDIFTKVLNEVDISDILSDSRVYIYVEGINASELRDTLMVSIRPFNVKTNMHIVLPKYRDLFPKEVEKVISIINECYESANAIASTSKEYGKRVCKNNILNMRFLPGCRNGYEYVNHFPKDMPVIIVAAGPSLEKNVDILKQAKGKALILVVDTAVKTVMKHGIIPDMIAVIDFIKPVSMFSDKGLDKIPILADIDANYEVLEFLKPKNYIVQSSDLVLHDVLFNKVDSPIQTMEKGGSVATAAIANMIIWGFKNIILIGQDLALTDNKVHAGEDKKKFDLNSWKYSYVKGINGKQVLTRKDFLFFIRRIEYMAREFPDVNIIDATEGGALKENTNIMTLRDAINKYCITEYDVKALIENVRRLFEDDEKNILIETLIKSKQELQNMQKRLKQGVVDCNMGKNMLIHREFDIDKLKKIVDSIGKLDDYFLSTDEYSLIVKMISKEDYEFADDMYIEEQDDVKESIRMFQKSGNYYNAIAEAIPEIISLYNETIESLCH